MTETVKRTKTDYKGIYFNETTGKYDIKVCYTLKNPGKTTHDHKQKWLYNIPDISSAQDALSSLKTEYKEMPHINITLQDALSLWESRASARNLSPVTIANTRAQFKMICRILPPTTDISGISEEVYDRFALKLRELGYSEESISVVNACLRKLINLCYKKRLLQENLLDYCENIQTAKREDYRIIPKEDFDTLDEYLSINRSRYRLLINLLYYTGIRIGEALALTWDDFEPCTYTINGRITKGMRLKISKSFVPSLKIIKIPKNRKLRNIPLPDLAVSLYDQEKSLHLNGCGQITDRIFTTSYSSMYKTLHQACEMLNLPDYHFHEFRHTYISCLIARNVPLSMIERVSGDTQQTILSRYSHCFGDADSIVYSAITNI